MLQFYKKDEQGRVELGQIEDAHWINICPPIDKVEIEYIGRHFNIPQDFLTDSLDVDERSRYEVEDGAKLILVNIPHVNESKQQNDAIFVTIPIGIILVDDVIITISPYDNVVLEKFQHGHIRFFDVENEQRFVLQIFDQTVRHYLESLKKLRLKRGLIENELYNSARNEELQQLLRIEKSLVFFVNSLSANELVKMKMKRTDFLRIKNDEVLSDYFEDIIIDNGQALEMSKVHTAILSGTMEAYASIVSNNLNQFIQRLTIITIILMVPTLVASFYGMNLKNLPLQESPYAFYIIFFSSVVFSAVLVWSFRRRKLF